MVESSFDNQHIVLNIHDGDFTTTSAIVDTINDTFGEGVAEAMDGVSVMVRV